MLLRFLPRTVALCATACLVSQCEKPATAGAPAKEDALATVAGQAITEKDLVQEAEWRRANHQAVPAAPELLKEMANRLALVEKAKQSGIADDPETQRRVQSVIIARLRENQLDAELAKVAVSDEELKAAYDSRSAEFARKGLDRFAILFQAADAKASDARNKRSHKYAHFGLKYIGLFDKGKLGDEKRHGKAHACQQRGSVHMPPIDAHWQLGKLGPYQ